MRARFAFLSILLVLGGLVKMNISLTATLDRSTALADHFPSPGLIVGNSRVVQKRLVNREAREVAAYASVVITVNRLADCCVGNDFEVMGFTAKGGS